MSGGYPVQLLRGALVTLEVAAAAACLGLALGLLGGLASTARSGAIRVPVRAATAVLRGVPEFVILLVSFFALSGALWRLTGGAVTVSPLLAGAAALGLTFGAYASEAFRGAFASVPGGQEEAAIALGLGRADRMRHVLLPQALRLAVPSLGNQWQSLLKDTSLVSVIGLGDLMRRADAAGQATEQPFTFLLAAAALYWLLLAATAPLQRAIEQIGRAHV